MYSYILWAKKVKAGVLRRYSLIQAGRFIHNVICRFLRHLINFELAQLALRALLILYHDVVKLPTLDTPIHP